MEQPKARLVLSNSIITPSDISRMKREAMNLDDYMKSQQLREPGSVNNMPRLSANLNEFVNQNGLSLVDAKSRAIVIGVLDKLHSYSPVFHVSFSVEPPLPYLKRLIEWMRTNLDSFSLITVGLQPNIGAGCILRTKNKVYDLSLRQYFDDKKPLFSKKIHEAITTANPGEMAEKVAEVPITVKEK